MTIDVNGEEASGVTTLVDSEESVIGQYDVWLDVFTADTDEFVRQTRTNVPVEFDIGSDPVIDRFDPEAVSSNVVDVAWKVSDPEGDLARLRYELITGDEDAVIVDRINVDVDGEDGSGITRLVDPEDVPVDQYEIWLDVFTGDRPRRAHRSEFVEVADDEDEDEKEDENDDENPEIDEFTVTDRSNPQWDRFDADWTVSSTGDDLDDVTTELLGEEENVLDIVSTDVTGDSASGIHELESRDSAAAIRLTVTDESGDKTVETESV